VLESFVLKKSNIHQEERKPIAVSPGEKPYRPDSAIMFTIMNEYSRVKNELALWEKATVPGFNKGTNQLGGITPNQNHLHVEQTRWSGGERRNWRSGSLPHLFWRSSSTRVAVQGKTL